MSFRILADYTAERKVQGTEGTDPESAGDVSHKNTVTVKYSLANVQYSKFPNESQDGFYF